MEKLKAKLFRLVKDELEDLQIGHSYNLKRLEQINNLCHLITFFESYSGIVDFDYKDAIKITNIFK